MQKREVVSVVYVALSVDDVPAQTFCETEMFNASCGVGEAVLLTRALYGRMRRSRCVRHDYGHVGCAVGHRRTHG